MNEKYMPTYKLWIIASYDFNLLLEFCGNFLCWNVEFPNFYEYFFRDSLQGNWASRFEGVFEISIP